MPKTVHIEPSGHTFSVEPGESILDAALRQGFTLAYGCRNGACGSCKGKVVEGGVDYGDKEPAALTEEERLAGMALFCIGVPEGDLTIEVKEIDAPEQIPMKTVSARLARMERVADDVMRLWLELGEGERLQYLAGQYVDIILPDGRKRAFSLANPPHADAYLELHVRRIAGGAFTERLFEEMEAGQSFQIEGPKGFFYLNEHSDKPVVLMATGTGFAPVKAIVEHAIAEGLTRPFHVYWGARTEADLYLDEVARAWAAENENIDYTPVLSAPSADWQGRTGYVQDAVMADFSDLTGYEVYAAGLPAMVYAARDSLAAKGLDRECYYSDAFEWAKD